MVVRDNLMAVASVAMAPSVGGMEPAITLDQVSLWSDLNQRISLIPYCPPQPPDSRPHSRSSSPTTRSPATSDHGSRGPWHVVIPRWSRGQLEDLPLAARAPMEPRGWHHRQLIQVTNKVRISPWMLSLALKFYNSDANGQYSCGCVELGRSS